MTDTTSTLTETEAAAALAVEGEEIEPGTVYAIPDGPGKYRITDTDTYAAHPRHRSAARRLGTAASFVDYVNRHRQEGTEVYAHAATSTLIAILDSHAAPLTESGEAGWQKHTAELLLETTPSWKAWESHDGGWMSQEEFAEFVEERALDIRDPDHATLADIATTFEATKSADFASGTRLQSGAVRFEYVETVAARSGQKGDLEVPAKLQLAVKPYIGGPTYALTAAFRYRIGSGGLRLGFRLERPEAVLESAFADIIEILQIGREATDTSPALPSLHSDVPIFFGKPS